MTSVALIADDFPPAVCGVGDYAEHLADALSYRGIDVTILTKSRPGLDGAAEEGAYRIRPCIHRWAYSEIGIILRELDRLPGTPIVHIQYSSASNYNRRSMINALPALLRVLRPKARLITTMHGFHEQRHLWRLRATPMLLAAHACILVHPTDYRLVTSRLRDRSTVAYVPISSNIPSISPTDSDRRAIRDDVGVTPSDFMVAFFGDMREDKGVLELITAASRVRTRAPHLKLVLVGGLNRTTATTEAYETALFTAIDDGLKTNAISMVRNPQATRVAHILRAADLAVFPFRDGAAVNRGSVLAAIANEAAVLTTAGVSTPPGFDEQYGVRTIPAGDVDALTRAIDEMLSHPRQLAALRRRSAAAARLLSWDVVAARHAEIYASVLRGGPLTQS